MKAPLVIVHDFGDVDGGLPWRDAFREWDGPVLAPDLPGHGGAPGPVGGNYEHADSAWVAIRAIHDAGWSERPVLVGVGESGWGAHLLAIGGRAAALILVDGLGGPWMSPEEWVAAQSGGTRRLADDPTSVGPPPPAAVDPRLAHGVLPAGSVALAERAFAALTVALLVVQTPAAPSEADAIRLPPDTVVRRAADRAPATVAALVTDWWLAQRRP